MKNSISNRKLLVKQNLKSKKLMLLRENCNAKLFSLADYVRKNKLHRVLAFIDPYGMALNRASLEILKGLE
jgi:hypothetical protein